MSAPYKPAPRMTIEQPGLVPASDYLAVLSMLYRRRTLMDRWRAMRSPGHWAHWAKRELAVAGRL